jgi:hypothetical protein
LLSGWNPEKRVLAPGDSQSFQAPLELPHAAWKRLPADVLTNPDVRFEIIGDAYLDTWLGEMTFPGALHQTIHVNMPAVIEKFQNQMLRRFFSWPPGPQEPPTAPPPEETPQGDTL